MATTPSDSSNQTDTKAHQPSGKDHGPGVRLPPPIVPILLVLSSWGLNALLPLSFDLPEPLGWLLLGLGIALSGAAFVQFILFKTSIIPHRPDQHLMTGGIFKLSRNPIYLAFLLFQASAGVFLASLWPLILLPLCYAFLRFYVIAKEERYLANTFGEEYQQLLRKTRRWL